MAKIFFNLVSILFFVLMVTQVESLIPGVSPLLVCKGVVEVASGDTCYAIAQQYHVDIDTFFSYNPNINCDALFVGQWVCLYGVFI